MLALGDPIIDSEENLLEFQNKVNFEGNKPEEPVRGQRFAVMLDPVAREAIGRGVIAGAMPVRINVIRQEDTFAELVLDETECLRSCPHGLTRILWKEEGLGVKWAVVRLGDRPVLRDLRTCGRLDTVRTSRARWLGQDERLSAGLLFPR